MTLFQQLDEYLGREFSVDHWADYAIDDAQELVERFGAADWQMLKSSWRSRPDHWQRRLANVLTSGDFKEGLPLLFEMILSTDDELAQQAVDSLSGLSPDKLKEPASPKVFDRLNALARSRSDFDAAIIREVIGRLQSAR